jgi:hypothetical protein
MIVDLMKLAKYLENSKKFEETLIAKNLVWIKNIFNELYYQFRNQKYEDILNKKEKLLKMFKKRGCNLILSKDILDFDHISEFCTEEGTSVLVPENFFEVCLDRNLNEKVCYTFQKLFLHEDIHKQDFEFNYI